MSRSLASDAVRTVVKAPRTALDELRAGKANLRMDANSVEIAPEIAKVPSFRALVREAMRRTDLSQKAFAINADQSDSVISEALNGSRHLAAEWLWVQPETFLT